MTRPRGGYVGFNRVPEASAVNSAASGVWTLREAEALKRAGTWPFRFENPTSLTGLQLWLDAADAGTLFDATTGGSLVAADGGVARWEDKSGNARHFTQPTSARRPARKTNQQNGLDALLFDGSNDYLIGGDYLDLDGTKQITVFLAVKAATSNVNGLELINKRDGTGTDNGWFFYLSSTGKLETVLVSSNNYFVWSSNDTFAAFNNGAVLTFKTTAGSASTLTVQYRNGSAIASTLANNQVEAAANTGKAIHIGILEFTSGSFFRPFDGNFCEVIAYDSALSNANRELVENYLLAKWGIT